MSSILFSAVAVWVENIPDSFFHVACTSGWCLRCTNWQCVLLPKLEHHDKDNLSPTQQQRKWDQVPLTVCSHKVWKVFLDEHLNLGDQKSTWMPVCLSKIHLAGLHLLHSSTDTTQQNIISGCLITALLKLKQVPTLFWENIYFRHLTSATKTNPKQATNNSHSSNPLGCFNKSHKVCDKYTWQVHKKCIVDYMYFRGSIKPGGKSPQN